MSKKKYVRDGDLIFVFNYDPEFTEMLHVYVRHCMEPEDVIHIFRNATVTRWNSIRQRFESRLDETVLYWFWIRKHRSVQIISCFIPQ